LAGEDPDTVVSDLLDSAAGLDFVADCTFESSNDYDDEFYVGEFDLYTECGEAGAGLVFLVATDPAEEYYIAVLGQVLSDADLDAIDQAVLSSFYVPDGSSGDEPEDETEEETEDETT
jgi:serine protease Do